MKEKARISILMQKGRERYFTMNKYERILLSLLLVIFGWGLGITHSFISKERTETKRIQANYVIHGDLFSKDLCLRCHK